jgi:putative multiple sugar transport system ATP-binding protein
MNCADGVDENDIVRNMVGRALEDRYPPKGGTAPGEIAMEVRNWTVHHPLHAERRVVKDVSFHVHKGEVLGIAGLMGAGRTELAMSLFGRSYGRDISGDVLINGAAADLSTVRHAIKAGLAYATEDRKTYGLVLDDTIRRNVPLADLSAISRNGIVDREQEAEVAARYRDKLAIKSSSIEQATVNLSGGNQQKVVLSKWLFADPDILILDEPTRGIDVGAKFEIYTVIRELAAQGKAIIVISSELPELLGVTDRLYVMNEGRFVAEMPTAEASQEKIMSKIVKSAEAA